MVSRKAIGLPLTILHLNLNYQNLSFKLETAPSLCRHIQKERLNTFAHTSAPFNGVSAEGHETEILSFGVKARETKWIY